MRAGIHTRGSTLFINHVEWALFGCEGSGNLCKVSKHQLVEVFHLSVKTADFFVHLFYFWHLPNFTIYLAQVISVFWYSLYRLIYKIQKEKEKERKKQNFTTELRSPPVGRLPSCMGTLSRELRECAADTKVIWMVGTATHVLHTGLNVRLGVNQFGTGAPGFCMQHLFTGVLLNDSKHMHNYLMQTKKTSDLFR